MKVTDPPWVRADARSVGDALQMLTNILAAEGILTDTEAREIIDRSRWR